MRHLVIVESPSKCKTIENYLGKDYRVIATCGHFRGLQSLDQIHPTTFEITFKNTKPKIVKFLKEEVGIAKSVILATDDDREGEAIAWHICKVCKLPLDTPRIVFHEITKEAIQYAITHPTVLNISKVSSQHTRQLLDLYIGFSISPLLWKAIQHTISAGRCQTPALHMIAEQQDCIEKQSSDTIYTVKGYFTNKEIEFKLERPLQKEEIDSFFSSVGEFKLEAPFSKSVSLQPPEILKTSTFQQKAGHALHLSPKQLMLSAQILYENGLITYMRTDQCTYSDEFIQKMKYHLANEFHAPKTKTTHGAHEGIRITHLDVKTTSFDKTTDRVYDFLYKHTLQTCMKPTLLIHKLYKTLWNDLYFVHTSVSIKQKGWSDVVEKDWSSYLDHLACFECKMIQAEEHLSHPEFHWTEEHLIRELEKNQIGRPSTYTHIIDSIKDKKYVNLGKIHKEALQLTQIQWKEGVTTSSKKEHVLEESRKLSLTPLGKEVNDFCYKHFEELFNYDFSSRLEEKLDLIEEGTNPHEVIEETLNIIHRLKHVKVEPKAYPTLHAGTYREHALILKGGMYGYYLVYKDQSLSLKEFVHVDKIASWIQNQCMPSEFMKDLIHYQEKNENILLVINSEWSLRKGDYGNYLFYKTKTMKKPKFYKYSLSMSKEDIELYIQKNIKV